MKPEYIFLAAVEKKTPAERDAYLAGACGDDVELRGQVAALLKAHDSAGSFLEQPLVEPVPTIDQLSISEKPGTAIGPYKLLEQIGEGGMGTVWMGQQTEPVKRLVALKLIKPGMDSKQVLARFNAERQALALMDHPNIAKVFDAGTTETGRPFFVMELVKGVPLTKYCDEHRLSPKQRLELFIPLCQAIQHAHQKGIIHRDIKPSNVMITLYDGKPVPKVIDFGVAKAMGQQLTEQTLVTGFGNVIGTLEYMSPEQAEMNQLDIDTRSDIYSLGVVLYELLTGSTPLDKKRLKQAAFAELLRVIREEEPQKPSTRLSNSTDSLPSVSAQRQMEPARLTKLVRGELDWIVMKALEKDRNRRYETANGFAMDVQRYLADEPVQACPPSAGYRLRKFARRNKDPVLAAALVFLSLVAGIIGTTSGLLFANKAWGAESKAKLDALEKKGQAERNAIAAQLANEAAQKRLSQLEKGNKILASIFIDLNPKANQTDGTLRTALGERLDDAVRQLQGEAVGDPVAVARLQATLGRSLTSLGYADKGEGLLLLARKTFTDELGPTNPDTLASMNDLALTYEHLARYADAIKLHEETLALRKANFGADHPDTLVTMNNLANSYASSGQQQDALKLRVETLALRKAKLGPDHPDTLMTMHNLANSYERLGRIKDALELREQTLASRRLALGPRHYDTLTTMNNLGDSYIAVGRLADALKLREEVLEAYRERYGPDHPDTLLTKHNVAVCLYALGRYADALKVFDETLTALKAKLGADHPMTLNCMNGLAACFVDLDRPNDAVKLFEQVLALRRVKLGPQHSETLVAMNNLANSYDANGRRADALKLREETVARMKVTFGPGHFRTLTAMRALGASYVQFSRHPEALKLREEMLAVAKAKLGPDHEVTLVSMD